jgi:hypothetical protein
MKMRRVLSMVFVEPRRKSGEGVKERTFSLILAGVLRTSGGRQREEKEVSGAQKNLIKKKILFTFNIKLIN